MTSPYLSAADTIRDRGYHVMPCLPGSKVPGGFDGTTWKPMREWSKWCDELPPDFLHEKWQDWPDAGVCVAHGNIVGLDIDTDRKDVAEAAVAAVGASPVRRKGSKGWMGYYRPDSALAERHSARVRWYDADGTICVELLLHGTQSVIPPTIHPNGNPYTWLTPDTFEDIDADDLPTLRIDAVEQLDKAFKPLGLTREKPRKADFQKWIGEKSDIHDLEKPWGRSLNDRAMEPGAIDAWFPAIGLPKTSQRGSGAWQAVADWRPSNSGRPISERNPNLKITPDGARDFGGGVVEAYTPISLVMAAKNITVGEAGKWLEQYVRPENGISVAEAISTLEATIPDAQVVIPDQASEGALSRRSASRFTDRKRSKDRPKSIKPTSKQEFRDAFPEIVPPFPVQDFEEDLTGLLREATMFIDESANMRSEQGAFSAAISALGTLMGGAVEVRETGLRTNIYVVGTAESGAGKSSSQGAMAKMMFRCGIEDLLSGSDFTSGSAILKEMGSNRPQLFSIDEFGDVIRRVLAPKAASHERDIGKILKDMYSNASGIYRGKSYATQERTDIMEPHLCLYGVTTHEAFWESLDGRSFSDGLLARFVMIPIGETETQTPDDNRATAVSDMITNVVESSRGRGNLGGATCKPVKFEIGIWDQWIEDRKTFQRHARRAELMRLPGAPSIIQRIGENGMKIAMISAMGRDPENPTITLYDYNLGIDVAQWSAIYMISSIEKYYVENSSHRDLKRIFEFIESAGSSGVTKSDITRKFQGIFSRGSVTQGLMSTLVEGGQVFEWSDTMNRTKRRTWYVATVFAKEFLNAREEQKQ